MLFSSLLTPSQNEMWWIIYTVKGFGDGSTKGDLIEKNARILVRLELVYTHITHFRVCL